MPFGVGVINDIVALVGMEVIAIVGPSIVEKLPSTLSRSSSLRIELDSLFALSVPIFSIGLKGSDIRDRLVGVKMHVGSLASAVGPIENGNSA